MKTLCFAVLISAALVACGGKNKSNPTTPDKASPAMKDGAMGGKTYGGTKPAAPSPTAPTADPCAGK